MPPRFAGLKALRRRLINILDQKVDREKLVLKKTLRELERRIKLEKKE